MSVQKYAVYETNREISSSEMRNDKMIVLQDENGTVLEFTRLEAFAGEFCGGHRVIKERAGQELYYIVQFLNFIFIDNLFKYKVRTLCEVTWKMVVDFFDFYRTKKNSQGQYISEQSLRKCVSAVSNFLANYASAMGDMCSLRPEELLHEEFVRHQSGQSKRQYRPRYQEKPMQSIPVPKLRDIPHNVYRILLDTTYQYDPMIAFAMESGRTAGLRPSEAMNMRQDASKVAVERCIRLYREGNRIRKIEIDLLKEYPLRSDEKAVGKIKRERIANVFPPLIPEFMQAYYETVCQSAASVVVREKSIVEENRVLKDSVTRLEKETEILHQRIQSLETEYQKAAETAKRYKKIIKDHVTPERAKALLDSALRPGVIKDEDLEEMRKIGMQSLAQGPVIATASEFNPVKLFADILDGEQ